MSHGNPRPLPQAQVFQSRSDGDCSTSKGRFGYFQATCDRIFPLFSNSGCGQPGCEPCPRRRVLFRSAEGSTRRLVAMLCHQGDGPHTRRFGEHPKQLHFPSHLARGRVRRVGKPRRVLVFGEALFEEFLVAEPEVGNIGGAKAQDVFEGAADFAKTEVHADFLEQVN